MTPTIYVATLVVPGRRPDTVSTTFIAQDWTEAQMFARSWFRQMDLQYDTTGERHLVPVELSYEVLKRWFEQMPDYGRGFLMEAIGAHTEAVVSFAAGMNDDIMTMPRPATDSAPINVAALTYGETTPL
jgi:hypothetical protein